VHDLLIRNPEETASNAEWIGVRVMSVRFIDTWQTPYSSMYHPIAFTPGNIPGSHSGSPSAPRITSPVNGSPIRLGRPRSRTSKATAFALRVDVVLRFTL